MVYNKGTKERRGPHPISGERNGMVLRIIFESIMVALLICGIIFEPYLVEWEEKMFSKIKKKFKNHKAKTKRKSFVVIEGKR